MNLPEFIEYVRESQGELSQKEFAGRMGISPQYLNDVLTGKREPGEGILRPMGVEKRVSYEKKKEPYAVETIDGESKETLMANIKVEATKKSGRLARPDIIVQSRKSGSSSSGVKPDFTVVPLDEA